MQKIYTIQKEEKKQNTCFVWNVASASDFRHCFYLLIWLVQKQNQHKQQILLNSFFVGLATQSVKQQQPGKFRKPVQKRCFHISQHFTELYQNTPLSDSKIFDKFISVLYFTKSASGLTNSNSLWGGVGFFMLWPAGRSHRGMFTI